MSIHDAMLSTARELAAVGGAPIVSKMAPRWPKWATTTAPAGSAVGEGDSPSSLTPTTITSTSATTYHRFTAHEDTAIAAPSGPLKVVAHMLGRSEAAVWQRRRKLVAVGAAVNMRRRWTPHEDSVVMDASRTASDIGTELGRPTQSVRNRRVALRRRIGEEGK